MKKQPPFKPLVLRLSEVADRLSLDMPDVLSLIRQGKLRTIERGRNMRITAKSFDEYCNEITTSETYGTSSRLKTPDGYIYIIRYGIHYKIGRAVDVQQRISNLSVKMPEPMELIHVIPTNNMIRAERLLHKKFAGQRVRGEWFLLTDEDIASLVECKELFV